MSRFEQSQGGMLTVEQAAQELGVKESTLRAWLLRRKIGRAKLSARCIRIPRGEVGRLIKENTVPARGGQQ
jgi:excisionase family DNA binding protein